jgi:hypothetical protein
VKTLLALFGLLLACASTQAQPTNTLPVTTNTPALAEAQFGSSLRTPVESRLELAKPNEIVIGKFTLSGSVVEAVKTGHPLQLFNPLAPAEYGGPADNVVFSPINGKVTGLKFFAIRF